MTGAVFERGSGATARRIALAIALALAGGLLLGMAMDAIGTPRRLNLLDPPLLGLLAWNLVVYLALLVRPSGPHPLAAMFHAGAAAFALGAIASLYLRGLAHEYRAGWDSTFLDAAQAHALLAVVLGPAAALTGLGMPSANELALLRYDRGGGENAARWIHLYAVTAFAAVVLPRTALALFALRRARPAAPQAAAQVLVVPYSYHVAPAHEAALDGALTDALGRAALARLAEPLPLGGEARLDAVLAGRPAVCAALFALTATPEKESHGAFLAGLRARAARVVVLVDESGFLHRFAGTESGTRREERRAAWRRAVQAEGLEAVFVDLAGPRA